MTQINERDQHQQREMSPREGHDAEHKSDIKKELKDHNRSGEKNPKTGRGTGRD